MKKQELKATLVYEYQNGKQRYYKLNHKITKGEDTFRGEIDIIEELKKEKERTKQKYKHIIPSDGFDVICISDANTHVERIVFGAFDDDILINRYCRSSIQISGVHTMLIHGGDTSSIKPDKVYIRKLASLNGFIYKDRL